MEPPGGRAARLALVAAWRCSALHCELPRRRRPARCPALLWGSFGIYLICT
uniref:Uncharacterized protein n=1 Tax=Gallus gallus TaxID=9031 RepID=Q5ZMD8_CHICK|nr:hypothetical protein RCJMB04_2h6 [Gallus gallus]